MALQQLSDHSRVTSMSALLVFTYWSLVSSRDSTTLNFALLFLRFVLLIIGIVFNLHPSVIHLCPVYFSLPVVEWILCVLWVSISTFFLLSGNLRGGLLHFPPCISRWCSAHNGTCFIFNPITCLATGSLAFMVWSTLYDAFLPHPWFHRLHRDYLSWV